MSDTDILHQGPAATTPAEVVQPSTEATPNEVVADGTGVSAPEQETEAQAAERIVTERRVRQERARRNQEAAFNRLASERDEFKTALLELTRRGQQPAAPQSAPADKPPARDQFDSWEDYEDARVDWKLEQKLKATTEKQAKELSEHLQQSQRQQYESQLTNEHVARTQAFAKSVPDFEDVTDRDDIVIPAVATEAIKSMPNSPAIVYAIGRDPSLAARMHDMSPTQQAAFVGQLSAALMSRVPQVSKAPAPGNPVGSRSAPATSLETATNYDDFVRLRRKQIAARR